MKKMLIAAAFLLFLSGCIMTTSDPFGKMDAYCLDWCEYHYSPEIVIDAEWHGNDDAMQMTRCGCILKDGFIVPHLIPYEPYGRY